MPDGSELTHPEERISHEVIVRANVALIFIKPHAHTPQCIDFVRKELRAFKGLAILGECDMAGSRIAERGLVDKHYAEIFKNAMCAKPSELAVTDERKQAFKDKFGADWDEAVKTGSVLNARDCALKLGTPTKGDAEPEPIPAKDLFNQWQTCGEKLKMAPGAYVGRLKRGAAAEGEDGDLEEDDATESLFVIDGFYPALREKFMKLDSNIHLLVVAFDPKELSWAHFRSQVVGSTDPTKAAEGSLRANILANYEELGLKEPPDNTDNGVHGSAGPLEALKERIVWLDFSVDNDPTGSKLLELAVWDESKRQLVESLLENPVATMHNGQHGAVFDLTEDKDTPDLYLLANNLAFAAALESVA